MIFTLNVFNEYEVVNRVLVEFIHKTKQAKRVAKQVKLSALVKQARSVAKLDAIYFAKSRLYIVKTNM